MNKKNWHPCELHCHTLHSDGSFTVGELTETAKERQLEGICLTDHNTTSGWKETENCSSLTVLKGIEWTTYFGHMLVLDCSEYVDWRDALPDNIDEKMKDVHSHGGLVGMAHPYQLGTPVCTGGHWDYNVKDFSLVNYMEIWSEGCPFINPANEKAKAKWLSLLSEGYRIAPSFGRDWHRKEGNIYQGACTYLFCEGELTDKKMKNAIQSGKTVISVGPLFFFETAEGETVGDKITFGEKTFKVTVDFERYGHFSAQYKVEAQRIRILTVNGEAVYEGDSDIREITINTEADKFYIFELWGRIDDKENQLLALTAPIYT